MIFDDLILHNAHTRLFYGKFCKRDPRPVGSECRAVKDLIHLFLRIRCIFSLGGPHARQEFFQRILIFNEKTFHVTLLSSYHYYSFFRNYSFFRMNVNIRNVKKRATD